MDDYLFLSHKPKSWKISGVRGTIHLLQTGDTLAGIANYYYGDWRYYKCIAVANDIYFPQIQLLAGEGICLFIPEDPWDIDEIWFNDWASEKSKSGGGRE